MNKRKIFSYLVIVFNEFFLYPFLSIYIHILYYIYKYAIYIYKYIFIYAYIYIYIYIYINRHVFRLSQDSSVWLGLTSREQLMSPECSKHQISRSLLIECDIHRNIYKNLKDTHPSHPMSP